ncbi:MAG: hypothetical protein RIC55_29310 [Pirellulaceae bacterium]
MMECALLLATASMGVDYGWQRTDNGSLEYIIQLEPALLEALAAGEPILSEVHPDAQGVTRFRILVGSKTLPRERVVKPTVTPQTVKPQTGAPSPVGAMPNVDGGERVTTEPAPRSEAWTRYVPLPGPAPSQADPPVDPRAVPSLPDIAATRPALPASARNRADEPIEPPAVAPKFGGQFLPPGEVPLSPPLRGAVPAPRDDHAFPPVTAPPGGTVDRVNPIRDPDRSGGLSPAAQASNPAQPGATQSRPSLLEPPQRFTPQPARDPNVQQAVGLQPSSKAAEPAPAGVSDGAPTTQTADAPADNDASSEPERPWATLVVGAFLLSLSIAVNVYLGMLARGFYRRYRDLAHEIRTAPAVDGI